MTSQFELPSWQAKAEGLQLPYMTEFAQMMETLGIKEQDVRGAVLIIGQGTRFPERLLVTTPESGFRTLRPEIESLVLCDPNPKTNPGNALNHFVRVAGRHDRPALVKGAVNYYPYLLEEFVTFMPPEVFDAALLFHATALDRKLQLGMGLLIEKPLKKDALFMGSGDFGPLGNPQEILEKDFEVVTLQKLSNRDQFGNLYLNHQGFVLRKRESANLRNSGL